MGNKEDHIKHVVLLMLENHSFDEMLGCIPGVDGINPGEPKRFNTDAKGKKYYQDVKQSYFMKLDPKHEAINVRTQIANGNSGFIQDFVANYPSSTTEDRNNIMGYYPLGFLPALHALAQDFTICDNWFSSLPGPTWPNRFFALSGTTSGYVKMPEGMNLHLETIIAQTQPTIFDRLTEAEKSWKIFYYDFPNSLIFANQRKAENLRNYHPIDEFFQTYAACEKEAEFPDFIFIEPKYFGIDQNDDHPPHNIMKSEKLIADVYNAIRSNDELWKTTLLIVLFDEHGGFYDHVTPPPAIPPDDKKIEYDFSQLGVRVPAILISPWVERKIDSTVYDHTSILKYLTEKWNLGSLGERTRNAKSIGDAITLTQRDEKDTVASIRVPLSELVKTDGNVTLKPSPHEHAIHVLAGFIKAEAIKEESPVAANVVEFVSFWANISVELKAWGGRLLQGIGRRIMNSGVKAEQEKINKITSVADSIIASGKQVQVGVQK